MLSVEISPEPPEPPQYPSLFVAGLATGQITAEYTSILLFFFRRGTHERICAGCNGGDSWNFFGKRILDSTGMALRSNGKRYRGSTKETNKKRAGRIAALRLSQALGGAGLLDRRVPSLQEFSIQFLRWVESATPARKTRKYYANGWRLLSSTKLVRMRLDHITKDDVGALRLIGSASNINCALRTLPRMLHKAGEANLLSKVPRFKLLPEHGRKLRLDDDAEQKLLLAAKSSNWKPAMFDLFRDVIILARNTGMRNGREL
jgi:hypothetical protein